MNTIDPELSYNTRRVVGLQLVTSLVVAGLFLLQGGWPSVSAVYGGMASVVIALLLSQRIKRASEAAENNIKDSMMILYIGAVQRFVLVIVFLGVGLALFKFNPIAVCVGFALTQLSYVVGSRNNSFNNRGQEI